MSTSDTPRPDHLRAGQNEVVRYIQKQPDAAKTFTVLQWRPGPEGDPRVLELMMGKTSRMIIFTFAELWELGCGESRRALEKVDRFFGRGVKEGGWAHEPW